MRIILIIFGLIVLALIYWFGKPGRRPQVRRRRPRGRVEPRLDAPGDAQGAATSAGQTSAGGEPGAAEPVQTELDMAPPPTVASARSTYGRRPGSAPPERIVSVLVVAGQGEAPFPGPDVVVAAEKAGLEYGAMGIFHRLIAGRPELGPVFSAANLVEPGAFDMNTIRDLRTPGLNLFIQLPGPMSALDAWDAMLPTAQRLAELLGGRVVDDQRNALGRQRVAWIRDDLRAWDRKHS